MKAVNIVAYTFTDGLGWYIDILVNSEKETFESWLYYEDYAIKHFMFGMQFKHISYIDFVNMVFDEYKDYTGGYVDEVMKDA